MQFPIHPILLLNVLLLILFLIAYIKKIQMPLLYAVIIGIVVRSIVIIISNGISNYDLDSWHIVGEAMAKNAAIYPTIAAGHSPYFPIFLYIESISYNLQIFGISQEIMLKMFFSLFDCLIIYLLSRLKSPYINTPLLYAINPITPFLFGFQGQFDAIPLVFVLLTLLILQKYPGRSMLFFSTAVAFKTWPILFIPVVLRKIKIKWYVVFIPAISIISIYIYHVFSHVSMLQIFQVVAAYNGIHNLYGITLILHAFFHRDLSSSIFSFIGLSIVFLVALLQRNKDILFQSITALLVFFVLTLGFGQQWLSWLIPFLLLVRPKYTVLFFIVASLYIDVSYYYTIMAAKNINIPNDITFEGIVLWATIVLITVFHMRKITFYSIPEVLFIIKHRKWQ